MSTGDDARREHITHLLQRRRDYDEILDEADTRSGELYSLLQAKRQRIEDELNRTLEQLR
jgi:hypothetical protein